MLNREIEKIIADHDVLQQHLVFPTATTAHLKQSAYEEYFNHMGRLLIERRYRCETLTLQVKNEKVLLGLFAYLKSKPTLFFDKLIVDYSDNSFNLPTLKDLLTALSVCHLSHIHLRGSLTLNQTAQADFSQWIERHAIITAIELPWPNSHLQYTLDRFISIQQRNQRIADYLKNTNKSSHDHPLEEKNQTSKLTVRKRPKVKKLSNEIDIEVATEVELEVEHTLAIEQQVEQKTPTTYINRAEFIRRAKNNEFKIANYPALTDPERIWDCWLGNIKQYVIEYESDDKKKQYRYVYDAHSIEEKGDEQAILDTLAARVRRISSANPDHPCTQGSTCFYPNPFFSYLTITACEKLLAHHQQCQFGLDFEHLPAGFELIESTIQGKEQTILNYNERKARMVSRSQQDLLAVQFLSVTTAPPLSETLFQQWLEDKSELPIDSLLKSQYHALFTQVWPCKQLAEFKQHLPILRQMPENEVSSKDYLEAAKKFQTTLGNQLLTTGQLDQNLLLQLLRKDTLNTPLIDKLKTLHRQHQLSAAHVNGLLTVYDAYGAKALADVVAIWEGLAATNPALFNQLHQHYFRRLSSYLPLLDNHFQVAISILANLKQEELAWWELLFTQHCEHVGSDDLYTLAKAFQFFLTQIKNRYHLFCYPKPQFKNIKSLPTALSRILTILSNTRRKDMLMVWNNITALNLESNGAIRLISDKPANSSNGQLILPQMQTHPRFFKVKHDDYKEIQFPRDLPAHGYLAIYISPLGFSYPKAKSLSENNFYEKISLHYFIGHSPDQLELEQNYYRYLAAQQHRFSIDFYQEAMQIVNEYFREDGSQQYFNIRTGLCALIAAATTGFKTSLCLKEEKESLGEVRELCASLKDYNLPAIMRMKINQAQLQEMTLRQFFVNNLISMPPLPYLKKMCRIAQKELTLNTLDVFTGAATQKVRRFEELFLAIANFAVSYHQAFYQGIRFVAEQDLNQDILFGFVELGRFIDSILIRHTHLDNEERIKTALIALMSTFSLTNQTIWDCFNHENINHAALAFALELLTLITNNKRASGYQLGPNDFSKFFNDLVSAVNLHEPQEIFEPKVVSCVASHFAELFPRDFFENLQVTSISLELKEKMRRYFSIAEAETIEEILLSFKGIEDKWRRADTVKSLELVCASLAADEKIKFLKNLITLNAKKDNTLKELNELLEEIAKYHHVRDFNYVLSCREAATSSHVIAKIVLFYKQVLNHYIYAKSPANTRLTRLDFYPLTSSLVLNSSHQSSVFVPFFTAAMADINSLLDIYPEEKNVVLTLVQAVIQQLKKQTPAQEQHSAAIQAFITDLTHFAIFKDKPRAADTLRCLGRHFEKNPLALQELLQKINRSFAVEQQYYLLFMIACWINNEMAFSPQELTDFIQSGHDSDRLLAVAPGFFACPPYPSLQQFLRWHNQYSPYSAAEYTQAMMTAYKQHNLQPCLREEKDNGFNLDSAQIIRRNFTGTSFADAELQALHQDTQIVKTMTTVELKAELDPELKKSGALTKTSLLAIMAELLYRSKGKSCGNGLSYEINTVQYLALLACLKSNGHITSEIATGEGKSRIMMLALACQWVSGKKTIDFVTSDLQLAERDYLEYQAFFRIIGAETRLISVTSPPSFYQIGGIHFSDISHLSRFRNKAKSHCQANKVIDPDVNKRALCLDEGDRIFDISETRFNYSEEANQHIKYTAWVYPLLIRFFNDPNPAVKSARQQLFYDDMDACSKAFMNFFKGQPLFSEDKMLNLESLPASQLETWQESAITALQLQKGIDYVIAPNVLIDTAQGPRIASEAYLIYGHHLSENSRYSFGIHQCLLARLNEELSNPASETSQECAQLKPNTDIQPFFPYPEKQIVYSSSCKNFLDDYDQGAIWSVTGTAGAPIEQDEAALLYGKEEEKSSELSLMDCVTVPRKNPLQRQDFPIRLTKDFAHSIAIIVDNIMEACTAGRALLIIAENDKEAARFNQALLAEFQRRPQPQQVPIKDWQYVDCKTATETLNTIIAHAGHPGVVTVATSRLGRGADIRLDPQCRQAGGLRVIGTFLPRQRDQKQIIGRSGRYGDPGDSCFIFDKQQLSQRLGKNTVDINFFLATEFYLQAEQIRLDHEKQGERLIRQTISDFRMKITDCFFEHYDKLSNDALEEKKYKEAWAKFTRAVDQLWNQNWPILNNLLREPVINLVAIKQQLRQFEKSVGHEWTLLRNTLPVLKDKLAALALDYRTEHLLRMMMPKRKYTVEDRTQVYQAYSRGLDGRATIYDELFTDWKAIWQGKRKMFANTQAWWQGTGILFADTRAWWAGKRPLFATLRTWMNKNDKKVNAEATISPEIGILLQESKDTDGIQFQQNLKSAIKKLDALRFLKPQKGDRLLSFKIQLLEAVLAVAYDRLAQGKKITSSDLKHMHTLLTIIQAGGVDLNDLSQKVTQALPPSLSFFAQSVNHDVAHIIRQRLEEEQQIRALELK